jgi:hypothetical protein
MEPTVSVIFALGSELDIWFHKSFGGDTNGTLWQEIA